MAYEKQTWQTGDIVTAAKLDHMEDGIANASVGMMVVTITGNDTDGYTADKTFDEIKANYLKIPIIGKQDFILSAGHGYEAFFVLVQREDANSGALEAFTFVLEDLGGFIIKSDNTVEIIS